MNDKENTPTGFARPFNLVGRLTHSRILGILRALEPAFIVITVIGVGIAGIGLWLDLVDRKAQRTARAWQTVASSLPGNTGKVEAAEYLAAQGHSLSKADFSPNSILDEHRKAPTCKYRVYLPALDLRKAVRAEGANLSCTDMGTDKEGKKQEKHAKFDERRLSQAKFIKSNVEYASFADAKLTSADFRAAQLGGADFRGATLRGAKLECANLNNVVFDDKVEIDGASIDYADLRGVRGMRCDMLKKTKGWKKSCQFICEENGKWIQICDPEERIKYCSAVPLNECNPRDIKREIIFRIDQVDRVVYGPYSIAGDANRCDLIHVVARLGGIGQRPPPREDETVWIGGSGYGYRHIPFKTGSRSDEFASDSLPELIEDYLQCQRSKDNETGKNKPAKLLGSLVEEFEDASTSVESEIICTEPWIRRARETWKKVADVTLSIVDGE